MTVIAHHILYKAPGPTWPRYSDFLDIYIMQVLFGE